MTDLDVEFSLESKRNNFIYIYIFFLNESLWMKKYKENMTVMIIPPQIITYL